MDALWNYIFEFLRINDIVFVEMFFVRRRFADFPAVKQSFGIAGTIIVGRDRFSGDGFSETPGTGYADQLVQSINAAIDQRYNAGLVNVAGTVKNFLKALIAGIEIHAHFILSLLCCIYPPCCRA